MPREADAGEGEKVGGQNTFYYDSSGVVRSDEFGCGMEPGEVGFY